MVAALVSLNIAIDASAVAVCGSIPSLTQNTSAATTATRRPGLMTRARQIRRSLVGRRHQIPLVFGR
jgi:acid phosphatase class B